MVLRPSLECFGFIPLVDELYSQNDWIYHGLVVQVQRTSTFFDTYVVRRGILFDSGTLDVRHQVLPDAQAALEYLQGRSIFLGQPTLLWRSLLRLHMTL